MFNFRANSNCRICKPYFDFVYTLNKYTELCMSRRCTPDNRKCHQKPECGWCGLGWCMKHLSPSPSQRQYQRNTHKNLILNMFNKWATFTNGKLTWHRAVRCNDLFTFCHAQSALQTKCCTSILEFRIFRSHTVVETTHLYNVFCLSLGWMYWGRWNIPDSGLNINWDNVFGSRILKTN